MKLTYWIAECLHDSKVYNLRAKTKREVQAMLDNPDLFMASDYSAPRKVTIEYDDGFDLMMQCLQEDGGYWEAS